MSATNVFSTTRFYRRSTEYRNTSALARFSLFLFAVYFTGPAQSVFRNITEDLVLPGQFQIKLGVHWKILTGARSLNIRATERLM